MCVLNKLDCSSTLYTDTQIIELFGQRQLVKWRIYTGAVHKVCHAIFDDFYPPPRHKLSQILDPP